MVDLVGRDLGRYHILEQLGEGGMATVYKAYDVRLERDVAVKIIRTDQFAPALLERILIRFEREAKALARLTHPNVVHVNDYGEQDGIPYLVMDYLPGGTLKQLVGKAMPWQEAVRLLLPIASALDYAHKHNIIHRDIKPSNILLTENNQPMLSDFGIAKILESEEAQTLTGTGVGVGTPEYMAPEQWTGGASTKSDQYSLGVVLYELVTGRKPYTADTPAAILLKQANDPLPRPSQFVKDLPKELEKFLLKPLAKDQENRFADMNAFAQALEGLLAGKARPPARTERVEHPMESSQVAPAPVEQVQPPAAQGAQIQGKEIPTMVVPPIPQLLRSEEVETSKKIVEVPPRKERPLVPPVHELPSAKILPDAKIHQVVKKGVEKALMIPARLGEALSHQPAQKILKFGAIGLGAVLLVAIIATMAILRGQRRTAASISTPDLPALNNTLEAPISTSIPVLPVLAGTPYPQPASAISAGNASQIQQLARWGKGSISQVAYAPDGQMIAVASSIGIYLYSADSLEQARFMPTDTWATSVAFSPDGKMLASGSKDNSVTLWDATSGQALRTLNGHTDWVRSVAFSPDGKTLASGSDDKTIILWDLASGQALRTLKGHTDYVFCVAFSPDGETLASGSKDNSVILWEVTSGQILRTLKGHTNYVSSVAFSPDGKTLASASDDKTIILWDLASGQALHTLKGHTDYVLSVAFSLNGETLATGSGDNTIILWDLANGEVLHTLNGHTDWVRSVAFSPDGKTLASGSDDGNIILWDAASGQSLNSLKGHTGWATSVAFSPDGKTLASGSDDKTIILWDLASGEVLHTLKGHTDYVLSVAFSPDGKTLATGSSDNTVILWDLASGQALRTLKGHTDWVRSVAFSPDGKTLASGSDDKTIILWDLASGQALSTLSGHTAGIYSVAFSPDGKTLASGSGDKTVTLWDLASGQILHTLKGHTDYVLSATFSPDGKTLASASDDKTIILWDAASGQALRTLSGHTAEVYSVAFSPDGKTLASGSDDKTIILWDLASGQALSTLSGHTAGVYSVAFSLDGKTLASGSADGTIRIWGVAP